MGANPRPPRRDFRLFGGLAVLVVVAVLAAVFLLRPPEVSTLTLTVHEVQRTLVIVGRVSPPSRAALGAGTPGVVVRVEAREGEHVRAGDLVVQLDDREARAVVLQSEAALAEAGATVESQIERAELEVEQAQRDLARVRAVVEAGGLTRQRLEQEVQREADALSLLAAARAEFGTAGGNAAIARSRAALEAARAREALTRIVAPADGVVLRRLVEPGDAVQAGQTLVEIATDAPFEVVVFPSEENLASLQVGGTAIVSADAYPDDSFPATIAFIAPVIDPTQGTIEVRLAPTDPPPYLRAEMTVSVNLDTGRRTGVPVLPLEAIHGLATTDPWVALVTEGRVERRSVALGFRGDAQVEILSGIGEQDRIIPVAETPSVGGRVRVEGER